VTTRAVCPGSYDPVTNGHIDVITRAATLFDEVIVAILHNPAKRGTFPVERREELLRQCLGSHPNVRVALFANTLLVDICRQLDATAIVKGLRSGTDFAYELPMALMNRQLTGVETVFLPPATRSSSTSSAVSSKRSTRWAETSVAWSQRSFWLPCTRQCRSGRAGTVDGGRPPRHRPVRSPRSARFAPLAAGPVS
jgi:pantetheine-phosphate adenylyltransferase